MWPNNSVLPFRFHPLRFTFLAQQSIHFPPGKSANILRGAFGTIFRKIACLPSCGSASSCEIRATCPYAQMFEPVASPGSPSGLADLPRPFVFRAWHLDGQAIPKGTEFHFDLNLFDLKSPAIAYLVLTFAQLAREGLGPSRSRVELTSVWQLASDHQPLTQLFDGKTLASMPSPLEFSLSAPSEPITRIHLRFVTPTELKSNSGLAATPLFPIVAARMRDRISTLSQAYGKGALNIDFRGFGEQANQITMMSSNLKQIQVERKSSRTHQTHSLGGFIGEAEYEGNLTEFLPYLSLAQWTGIGRQTVWGKGEVQLTCC